MSTGVIILIIFIVILILAGLGIGLYFILRNEKKENTNNNNGGNTGATGTNGTILNYPALVSSQLPSDINHRPPSSCCSKLDCKYNAFPSTNNDQFTYSFDPMYEAIDKNRGNTGATGATGSVNSNVKISSIDIDLTGSHYFDCGEGSKVILDIYDTNNLIINTFTYNDPHTAYFSSTSNVKITGTIPNPPPLSKYVLTLTTSTGNSCCYYSFIINLNFIVHLS